MDEWSKVKLFNWCFQAESGTYERVLEVNGVWKTVDCAALLNMTQLDRKALETILGMVRAFCTLCTTSSSDGRKIELIMVGSP